MPLCFSSPLAPIQKLTHLELDDPTLSSDNQKMDNLLEALCSLPNLCALSLPQCIDLTHNQTPAIDLNNTLKKLKHLQRLNLSYCSLQGQLQRLLEGLHQRLTYLNLKDCRLLQEDVVFLAEWRPLARLRELNLSHNNLASQEHVIVSMMERMSHLTCFSVSYCSLSLPAQQLIATQAKECSSLKVFCMQSFTPLQLDTMILILDTFTQVRVLQKVLLFPEAYAFPGDNEWEREANKEHALRLGYQFLATRNRHDLELQ